MDSAHRKLINKHLPVSSEIVSCVEDIDTGKLEVIYKYDKRTYRVFLKGLNPITVRRRNFYAVEQKQN